MPEVSGDSFSIASLNVWTARFPLAHWMMWYGATTRWLYTITCCAFVKFCGRKCSAVIRNKHLLQPMTREHLPQFLNSKLWGCLSYNSYLHLPAMNIDYQEGHLSEKRPAWSMRILLQGHWGHSYVCNGTLAGECQVISLYLHVLTLSSSWPSIPGHPTKPQAILFIWEIPRYPLWSMFMTLSWP